MLRCFDCNAAAADAVPLVEDGSWMGPSPSKTAPEEPVTSQKRSTLNTEYKLKFRPFSDYSYVDGQFSGARDVTDGDASGAGGTQPGVAGTPWFEEVVELRKKASSYKVRGWGREMAQPHLAHLYDKEEDPVLLAERKIISALYLETLKPGFVREERGRSPVTTGGASVRQQSHPPPSSRKSPGAAKMTLKLQSVESGRRPHSAQPVSDRHAGDVVDRGAKGRSPAAAVRPPPAATHRTPTAAVPAGGTAPAKVIKKRPSTAVAVEKSPRPPVEKAPSHAAERVDKSPRAPPPPTGTPDSTGKGIRGGTPRSRSAHRLAAAGKAKSPTKPDKSPATTAPDAMSASAPAPATQDEIKPAVQPEAKETPEDVTKPGETDAQLSVEVELPPENDVVKLSDDITISDGGDEVKQEMVRSAPEPTRVRSPDTMAPIKSPEPVNWTVPLDTGKTFTVTQNVMPGHGSPQSSRADSLRSPGDETARSPYPRAVTDVSHLRNGEHLDGPVSIVGTDSPLVNSGDPAQPNGQQPPTPPPAAADTMSMSMTGDDLQRSFHATAADPMTASMTGDDLQRSFHTDAMTSSMTGDQLERSLHAEPAPQDPMSVSMTGDSLQRSSHEDGGTTAAVTATESPFTTSFHAEQPPPSPPEKPARRVLDDPLLSSGFAMSGSPFGHAPAAATAAADEPPGHGDRPPSSSLFSSGSAGPARFSHELFGSTGARPADTKTDAPPEKPTYRVI